MLIFKKERNVKMSKIEQLVLEMATPFAEEIACEVMEVEYKKEGPNYFLRIFLDNQEGRVGIDECEQVSRKLSDELDKLDPIPEAYMLEVCSPGIDRKLKREKDFVRFMGSDVDVKLYSPVNGEKEFEAVLVGFENNVAALQVGKEVHNVDMSQVVYIKLAVKF